MNSTTTATTTPYSLLAAWEQFRLGWDRHIAKQPITACTTLQQRRGYWAALNAEAAANLPATSADRLGF